MKILKSKKKNDQIIYEYGNTFKSILSLKYKTYDLKIYIYEKPFPKNDKTMTITRRET